MLAMPTRSGRLQCKFENAPGLQRIDDSIHVASRRSEAGVQPFFVVFACLRDASLQLWRHRLPCRFVSFELGTMDGLDRRIAIHCAGGYRSSIAASILHQYGITNLVEMAGGLAAWQAAQLPLVSEG